ncbi:porin family protein [Psychroserpens sp.]
MKKLLFCLAIAVFGIANLNAQDIEFGVKGGLNFASISGDDIPESGIITDFHFGVMAELPISDKFSFQPELLYSGQGYAIDRDIINLNYINVPLMAKYYLTKRLSVEAGPQIGFLISAKNESVDIKDQVKSFDFGANLGVSYKLDSGLNFGARYNFGLSNINDISGFSNKNQNGVVQVSIGYFFF